MTISCRGARADARWTTTCRCSAGPAIMTKAVTDVMAEKKDREFVATGIKLRADLAKGWSDIKLKQEPIRRSSSRRHWKKYLDEMAPVDK